MIKIITTESGGPAAIGVLKSSKLSKRNIKTISCDVNNLAAGLYYSDESETVPSFDDPQYMNKFIKLIKKYKPNILLPTGESDLNLISEHSGLIEQLGCKVFISSPETILLCQDKLKFYEKLKLHNIPQPITMGTYLIQKPRFGRGSKGVNKINLNKDLIQEYLPGKEYTVDVFCDMESNILSSVIRERIDTKGGISSKGKIVSNSQINKLIPLLVEILQLKGPSCIQFKEDQNKNIKVLECNPRLGGGTIACTLAGVNYVDLYIDLLENKSIKVPPPKKITFTRYFEEIII